MSNKISRAIQFSKNFHWKPGFSLRIDSIHSASRVWTCGTMYYILVREKCAIPNKFGLIEASAWRRLPSEYNRSSLDEFLDINRVLIKEARMLGHDHKNGRRLKDLEILAELQHLGAATCLIDFTYNALTALWFACQPDSSDPSNGKVGAVLNNPNKIEEITPKVLEERDFDSFFNGIPKMQNHISGADA